MALDKNIEAFVMHVTSLSFNLIVIHLARKAQIVLLAAKKLQIPIKYSDFSNFFLKKTALILLEATEMNQYAIELEKNHQPPYGLIYILGLVELKTLKTYIKTNFANGFI